ncbi:hypothetical protein MKW92_033663 [Papaver armeniacum]|nr:hypothetical protein MKW92_033663 [Papaver armeniacum]
MKTKMQGVHAKPFPPRNDPEACINPMIDENASVVCEPIVVDREVATDKVRRIMTVNDGKLSVHFESVEARFLRASYSSFLDVLTLSTKTIKEFWPVMQL